MNAWSRRQSAFTGQCEARDCSRAGLVQDASATGERRTSGNHVIDDNHPPSTKVATHLFGHREGVADIAGSRAPAKLMLGRSALGALERDCHGQAKASRAAAREKLGLIEAALPTSLSVDGHRHEQIATGGRSSPTLGHQLGQWLDEAQLAFVLERMQRGSRGAGERGAPFQLDNTRWLIGRQPQWGRGRFLKPPRDDAAARRAQRHALALAAGACWRQQQVKQCLHGRSVNRADHRLLAGHLSSA